MYYTPAKIFIPSFIVGFKLLYALNKMLWGYILACLSFSYLVSKTSYKWASAWDFPTMWYVRPAKPHISLHIHAVWSEPLLVAWVFYDY